MFKVASSTETERNVHLPLSSMAADQLWELNGLLEGQDQTRCMGYTHGVLTDSLLRLMRKS
jgi:hypothetical protein